MTGDYVDQTKTGYLLQEASKQPDQPRTIRHLNDIGTQVVRFFLHACLYLACGDEDEHRDSMLSAIIEANPTDVKEFFWQHMLLDLKITCKILNITTDELIILFHKICFNFVKSKSQNQLQENKASFSSKGERQQWEHSFYKTYLAPTFKAVSDNVSSVNNAIKKYLEKDDSNQSRIYFMAYELTTDPNSEFLYEMEKFWRFRPLISFNFMAQELKNTTKPEHFKILKQFAHLIDHLELTFHLPSIMHLLNLLKSQLNKRVSKYKSQNMSVRQFFESCVAQLSDGWTIQKAEKILERFQFVWSAIKDEIDRYSKKIIWFMQSTNMILYFPFSDSCVKYFTQFISHNQARRGRIQLGLEAVLFFANTEWRRPIQLRPYSLASLDPQRHALILHQL